eukprot:66175_1
MTSKFDFSISQIGATIGSQCISNTNIKSTHFNHHQDTNHKPSKRVKRKSKLKRKAIDISPYLAAVAQYYTFKGTCGDSLTRTSRRKNKKKAGSTHDEHKEVMSTKERDFEDEARAGRHWRSTSLGGAKKKKKKGNAGRRCMNSESVYASRSNVQSNTCRRGSATDSASRNDDGNHRTIHQTNAIHDGMDDTDLSDSFGFDDDNDEYACMNDNPYRKLTLQQVPSGSIALEFDMRESISIGLEHNKCNLPQIIHNANHYKRNDLCGLSGGEEDHKTERNSLLSPSDDDYGSLEEMYVDKYHKTLRHMPIQDEEDIEDDASVALGLKSVASEGNIHRCALHQDTQREKQIFAGSLPKLPDTPSTTANECDKEDFVGRKCKNIQSIDASNVQSKNAFEFMDAYEEVNQCDYDCHAIVGDILTVVCVLIVFMILTKNGFCVYDFD